MQRGSLNGLLWDKACIQELNLLLELYSEGIGSLCKDLQSFEGIKHVDLFN